MKLLKNIGYYLLIGVLGLYIFFVVFSPDKMMDTFGFRTFIVLSNSMEPRLNVNDMIILAKVDEDELQVGDIITFEVYIDEIGEDAFVTHYLGAIEEDGENTTYKTRRYGLDEDEYDDWYDRNGSPYDVTFNDIEGELLFEIPYVGYVQDAFQNRVFLGLILLNVGIIYIAVKMVFKKDPDEEEFIEEDDEIEIDLS